MYFGLYLPEGDFSVSKRLFACSTYYYLPHGALQSCNVEYIHNTTTFPIKIIMQVVMTTS
jgi:hypothetical protein